MHYLRIALGLFLLIAVILFLFRPAEPVPGINEISYDGETLQLNGRSVTEPQLREMEFPEDSEIQLVLTDAKHVNVGAQAGLLHHWNQRDQRYYHLVEGVPLRVDSISWRQATPEELRQEIQLENARRRAEAAARRSAVAEPKEFVPASVNDPAPEIVPRDAKPPSYVPEDKNRYYWNNQLVGNAKQTRARLRQVRLTRPGALVVITPKSSEPPPNVKSIKALGFPEPVTEVLERAGRAGVYIRVHRGEGFEPPTAGLSGSRLFGGLFFAYLGPLVIMLGGIFIVSWFLEGGRADHEK